MKGSIEVICGPMFSGKTEELIKRINRTVYAKQTSMVFKPEMDNRYSDKDICSHNGTAIRSTTVKSAKEIEVAIQNYQATNEGNLPEVIAIEEIQFFDEDIVQLVYDLKCYGVRVVAAGLDMNWSGAPWAITSTLLALADSIDKQKAVCVICGQDASHSYLKNKTGEMVQVGSTDLYEARCFNDWK
jgi:thymidine kinase